MGLLDTIGALAGQMGSGQNGTADPKAALIQGVLAMLANNSGTAGVATGTTGGGGLAGLMQQFNNAGLGNVVSSWISSGHNLPISADQIKAVLGSSQLAQLAEQAGLSHSDAANHLSALLPGIIDKLTPQGQVPQGGLDAGSVENALGGLLTHFLGAK
jgi:uncharacterized protein YidB (DUF937 family)